jgi:predicted DNA-binding transcriptional regulator YafY
MSRSTRLFEIIQVLRQSTGPITARQIAEGLEVTVRTVYRDIAALQAMRLPIKGEAGVGYVLRSGFDLPPLMFSPDELEAILVGLALLGRTGDPGLERAARNASAKITEVLPDGTPPPAALHVSRWNRIPQTQVSPGAMRRFIRDEAELGVCYLDLQDRRTERRIKPLALIYYIDAVVLAAWCGLRQDFRHFRIDRILDCAPTGETFVGQSAALLARWERENRPPE